MCNNWQIPPEYLIIFSPKSPHSVTPRRALTEAEFDDLLMKSGGSHGHAKLYALEIGHGEELVPDVSCFEPLSKGVWLDRWVCLL